MSTSRLQKEEKALEKLIEAERQRLKHRHRRKSRSPFDGEGEESAVETDQGDLDGLTVDQIKAKFDKLASSTNLAAAASATTSSAVAASAAAAMEEASPSKLYCICRRPHDGVQQMICCDYYE